MILSRERGRSPIYNWVECRAFVSAASSLSLSLSLFLPLSLGVLSAHLSSSRLRFTSPRSPLERRSPFVRPVSGIKIPGRSSRANVAPGGIIHLTRRSRRISTRACEQKRRYSKAWTSGPPWNANRNCENGETCARRRRHRCGERFLAVEAAVSRTLWLENAGIKGQEPACERVAATRDTAHFQPIRKLSSVETSTESLPLKVASRFEI